MPVYTDPFNQSEQIADALHYNAFISYKHEEKDIKVAEAIEKGLERFHIPAAIKKKTGVKKIERIFRDRDELPITSDLGDTISKALFFSDYLIVICSTHTKESQWVQREIEYFLRNHTRQQILTVLVEGEPQDVIPPILLSEDRPYVDVNGNMQVFRVQLEPLSCDYRVAPSKAKKEELPRLASVLIGCSYDELMNRHRQYKMRRVMAAFAAVMLLVLAFAGYMGYSRNRINAAYQESLRNQAKYLASESETCFDDADRITALQLALYSLDKTNGEPTPDSIRALTMSTYSYESSIGSNINVSWNYSMPNIVSDFTVSDDGIYLAAMDTGSTIAVWEIETHAQVFYQEASGNILDGILFAGDHILIAWAGDTVTGYDINTASKKWEYKMDFASVGGEDTIEAVGDNLYYTSSDGDLYILDINDGTEKAKKELGYPDGSKWFYYENIDISSDEKRMCFSGGGNENNYVGVMDLDTMKATCSDALPAYVKELTWGDDDRIVAAYNNGDAVNSRLSDTSILSKDHTTVACYDSDDMSLAWENDFVNPGVPEISMFFVIPEKDRLVYASGAVAEIYDMRTGEVISNHNANESIIDVSDRDKDGSPMYVTKGGSLVYPASNIGPDALNSMEILRDNLNKIDINNGIYAHEINSKDIVYYGIHVCDEEWNRIGGDTVLGFIGEDYYLDDYYLATVTQDEAGETLSVFDPETERLLSQIKVSDISDNCFNLEPVYSDKENIYVVSEGIGIIELFKIDPRTKDIEKLVSFDSTSRADTSYSLTDGRFVYLEEDEDGKPFISLYNISSGEKKSFPLEDVDYAAPYSSPQYVPVTDTIYYADKIDYIIDVKTGEMTRVEFPESWQGTKVVKTEPNGKAFIISDGKRIVVVDNTGSVSYSIMCPGASPAGIGYYADIDPDKDQIIAYYENGLVYRYLYSTGEFAGRIQCSLYTKTYRNVEFDFDYDHNLLYTQAGNITQIIDTNEWLETACFGSSIGHYRPRDIFITMGSQKTDEYEIGYFKHYTAEDLKKKAEDMLQGVEMSDEKKSEYGID